MKKLALTMIAVFAFSALAIADEATTEHKETTKTEAPADTGAEHKETTEKKETKGAHKGKKGKHHMKKETTEKKESHE